MAAVGGQVDQVVEQVDRRGDQTEADEGQQALAEGRQVEALAQDHRQEDEQVFHPLMRAHGAQRFGEGGQARPGGPRQCGHAPARCGLDRIETAKLRRHQAGKLRIVGAQHHALAAGLSGAGSVQHRVVIGQVGDVERIGGDPACRVARQYRAPILAQRAP